MISTLKELLDAKTILKETYVELIKEGHTINMPKVGIMVEVPSTAIGIEKFLPHIDFLSIGTNDLIQYMFAADRMNERVAYLYQPYNPILLTTIKSIIDKANKHGIIISVCGEMVWSQSPKFTINRLRYQTLKYACKLDFRKQIFDF